MLGDMWVKVLLPLTILFSSSDTLPQNTFISPGVTGVQAESKEAMKKHGHALFAAALNSGAEREEYAKISNRQLDYGTLHAVCNAFQPLRPLARK